MSANASRRVGATVLGLIGGGTRPVSCPRPIHRAAGGRCAPAAALVAALVVIAALGACSSPAARRSAPDLVPRGSEAPAAVTVPSGPEPLPTWQRHDGRATLAIPADLLFAKDSADLGPGAIHVLSQVRVEIGSHPDQTTRVLVEGHADGDGDAGRNQELSERRAVAVGDWLAVHGADPSTITTRGWGETRPAAEEIDEAAKAENRRVVVTVTFTSSTSGSASPPASATRQIHNQASRHRAGRSNGRRRRGAEPPQRRAR